MGWQMLLVLLCVSIGGSNAVQCVPFEGQSGFCSPYLEWLTPARSPAYLVSVNEGWSLNESAALAESVLPSAIRAAPSGCRKSVLQLLCLSFFPPCTVLSGLNVHVPQPVCRAACAVVEAECGGVVSPADLPDCRAVVNGTTPLYPEGPSVVHVRGYAVETPCVGSGDLPPAVETTCPNAFSYSREDDRCLPTCPLIVPTDRPNWRRQLLYWLSVVLVALSIFLLVIHLMPYILLREHRRFPINLLNVYSFFVIIALSPRLFRLAPNIDDVVCLSNTESTNRTDLCIAQGAMNMFGSFGALGTLIPVSFWFFFTLVFPGKFDNLLRRTWVCIAVYSFVLLLPVAVSIPMIAHGWVGWVDTDVGNCSLGHDEHPERALLYVASIFTVLTLIVVVIMSLIFFYVVKHQVRVHDTLIAGLHSAFKGFWRLQLFLLVQAVIYSYTAAVLWVTYSVMRTRVQEATEYYECNAEGRTNCHIDNSVPYLMVVMMWVLFPSIGISQFVIFQTGHHMRRWWSTLVFTGRICLSLEAMSGI